MPMIKKTTKSLQKPSASLKAKASKFGVRLTTKQGKKTASVLKAQVARKASTKSKKATKSTKKVTKSTKKTKKVKRKVTRRSRFGVGGSYMPLSSIMSPYPSSLSGPPFL